VTLLDPLNLTYPRQLAEQQLEKRSSDVIQRHEIEVRSGETLSFDLAE
jgi:hypothetical protein